MLVSAQEMNKYKQFCNSLNRESGVASLPIQEALLEHIRVRVKFARELEKLEFGQKKKKLNDNWLRSMAKDADMVYDR